MPGVTGVLDRFLDLRPEERAGVLRAAAVQFLLLTALYSLRPLRDALSVSGGSEKLPWLFTATFLGVLALTPFFGLAVSKLGRARLVRVVYRTCAAVLLLLFAGLRWGPHLWSAYAFFVWISVFNMFALSLFWSVMADRHPSDRATRLFGPITIGASLGAILGPTVAAAVATWLQPEHLLLFAACMFELALRVGRDLWEQDAQAQADRAPIGGNPFAGLIEILNSKRLLTICGYLLVMTTASTVVYFAQGAILEVELPAEKERTQLLAAIDFVVNVLALLGQAFLASRVMRRGGIHFALIVLPIACVIGFAGLGALPVIAVLAAFQVARRAGNYALSKPAREVLFTGVDRSERYKAKSFIDTVVYRGGDAVAGWAYAGLLGIGLSMSGIAFSMVPICMAWVGLGWWLGRSHNAQADADQR
jgi:AAA family ATP:ADP antiporter